MLSLACDAEETPTAAPIGAATQQAVSLVASPPMGPGGVKPSLQRPFIRPTPDGKAGPPGLPQPLARPVGGQLLPGMDGGAVLTPDKTNMPPGYYSSRQGVTPSEEQDVGPVHHTHPEPYAQLKEIPYYPKPEPVETPAELLALPLSLVDFTEAAGLAGLAGGYPRQAVQSILATSGQGVAWLDANGDDWPELLILLDRPVLFRNLQNGRFEREPRAFPPLPAVRYRGIASGDVDLDGDIDLYLSAYRGGVLLINTGKGTFENATARWGLTEQPFGMSSSLADLDHDGRLDLIIGNYLAFEEGKGIVCEVQGKKEDCGPHYYPPALPTVWRNTGARFENVSKAWGFDTTHGRALGQLARDFDGDGRLEVLFANDMTPGDLMVPTCPKGASCDPVTLAMEGSPGKRAYENRGMLSGLAYDSRGQVHAGMGVDVADSDRDGRLDVVMTAFFQEGTSLYRAVGPLQYRDISWQQGVGPLTWPTLGFGVTFLDVDRNGEEDLFITNGHVLQYAETFLPGSTYAQAPQLLFNKAGHFWEVSSKLSAGAEKPIVGRGLARADFDRDGRVDVAISTLHGGVKLLRNVSEGGQAVSIRLQRKNGADAQGVFYRVKVGERWRVGSFGTDGSYLSAHEPWVQVGLGPAPELSAVEVSWAPGKKELFGPLKAGSRMVLKEGEGRP